MLGQPCTLCLQCQELVLRVLQHQGFSAAGSLPPAVWDPGGPCKYVLPGSKQLPHPDPVGDAQGSLGPTCSLPQ